MAAMERAQIKRRTNDDWSRRSSSTTREKYKRVNKSRCSELVVGTSAIKWRPENTRENLINLEIKTDKGDFGTVFSKPQQTSGPGLTPLYSYRNIQQSNVLSFPEPPAGQIFQPHQLPPEDRGVIYPPSFDEPSQVQASSGREVSPSNVGYVLHMDAPLIVKDELMELCPPPCVTHKHQSEANEETLPVQPALKTLPFS